MFNTGLGYLLLCEYSTVKLACFSCTCSLMEFSYSSYQCKLLRGTSRWVCGMSATQCYFSGGARTEFQTGKSSGATPACKFFSVSRWCHQKTSPCSPPHLILIAPYHTKSSKYNMLYICSHWCWSSLVLVGSLSCGWLLSLTPFALFCYSAKDHNLAILLLVHR